MFSGPNKNLWLNYQEWLWAKLLMYFAADQCGLLAPEPGGTSGRTTGCHCGQKPCITACLHIASKLPKIYSFQRQSTYLTAKCFFLFAAWQSGAQSGIWAACCGLTLGKEEFISAWFCWVLRVVQAKWVPQEFSANPAPAKQTGWNRMLES